MAEKKTGVAAWKAQRTPSRNKRAVADGRRRIAALVALLALCIACIVCFTPLKETIKRGLSLKGGTAVTETVATEDGKAASADDVSRAASVIKDRMSAVGVAEVSIRQGDGELVIALPEDVDAEQVVELVGGAGKFEFVRMDEIGDAEALEKINAGTSNAQIADGTYTSFMDSSSISSVTVTEVSSGSYAVTLMLDEEGAETFARVTGELAKDGGGQIAIVVDGRVTSAPGVSEEITGGQVSISGDYSALEANAIKAVIDTGALPLNITYKETSHAAPLMGDHITLIMLCVAGVAVLAVTVFVYTRYRGLALLVLGASLVFSVTLLGMLAAFSRAGMLTLTIHGVVGGVLAAITQVLATWLMISCFHSKVKAGGSVRGASISAPREGLRPLALPCSAALVVGCVLVFIPMPSVHELGVVLTLGIVSGAIAVYWFAVTTLRLLAMGTMQANPSFWGLPAGEATEAATQGAAS